MMKKKYLFIDRDGTLIREPADYQTDTFEKLEYYPGVFTALSRIVRELDFTLVMVTNQDGLGREGYPWEVFNPIQKRIMDTFEGEGIRFEAVLMDTSFPQEDSPNRKPRTGLVEPYMRSGEVDMENSFVIGDRVTDIGLACNMGCRGIWLNNDEALGGAEAEDKDNIVQCIALKTQSWADIYRFLKDKSRIAHIHRTTKETDIDVRINLDGSGKGNIDTGLGFFDHMLDQIARHGMLDLCVHVRGDLQVDEHHTVEDTALALGEAFRTALGTKKGIERYGFCLPMDDCDVRVALDFSGRAWLNWQTDFKREKVGELPTEMFYHFFKSFSDAAAINLLVRAEGENEHHKIEGIFKAFAKSLKMAVSQTDQSFSLPSTKGAL